MEILEKRVNYHTVIASTLFVLTWEVILKKYMIFPGELAWWENHMKKIVIYFYEDYRE